MSSYLFQSSNAVQRLIYLLQRITIELQKDNYLQKAAALTYTTLFAIVPLLMVIYSMLSAIPALHGIAKHIQDCIFSNFVPSAGNAVAHYLDDFSRQAHNLTVLGMSCFLLYWAILTL